MDRGAIRGGGVLELDWKELVDIESLLDFELLDPFSEGCSSDPEKGGCFELVPLGFLKGTANQLSFNGG